MPYDKDPKTPFQKFIRLTQEGKILISLQGNDVKHRYEEYY